MDWLREFLLDTGLVSRDELLRAQQVAEEKDTSLGKALIQGGFVSGDNMRRAYAATMGIPLVQIDPHALSIDVLTHIPEPVARAHMAIAYASGSAGVEVAVLDLDTMTVLERQFSPSKFKFRLTDEVSMKRALLQYQKLLKEQYGAVFARELSLLQSAQAADADHSAAVVDAAARVLDALLRHALMNRAQEILLQPYDSVRVRYRMHDSWYDALTLPLPTLPPLVMRARTLGSMPLTEPHSHGRFTIHGGDSSGAQISVSASVAPVSHPTPGMHTLVLSLNDIRASLGYSLASLSCRPRTLYKLRRALSHTSGLVLVCGKAGAGKTTMLYTLLDQCASSHKALATVETTVHTHMPSVSHMEVREEYGMSAASCLRAQLRQGADVVMIDTQLDSELIEVALHAANRGVLVLMSVEAASAADGLAELQAQGALTDMLAVVFTASVGVAQAPLLCQKSKIPYKLSRGEQRFLEEHVAVKHVLADLKTDKVVDPGLAWKDAQFFAPAQCDACDKGYAGSIGLQEVIPQTATLKELMRTGADAAAFAEDASREGAETLREDALYKAVQGRISAGDALKVAGGE
ncbi:MAG TPA: ATPase, T2SS/T4P/T4SS family [Candidatus Paceibacterota bacterium]|nr:ATPase, T2SS/T4P/T4SS family [Candidatus Paceibacterota bacterium]